MDDKITLDFLPNARRTSGQYVSDNHVITQSDLNHRSRQMINRYYETKDLYFASELVLAQKTRARQILTLDIGIVETIQDLLNCDSVIAAVMLKGLDYLKRVDFSNGGGGMCFRVIDRRL